VPLRGSCLIDWLPERPLSWRKPATLLAAALPCGSQE